MPVHQVGLEAETDGKVLIMPVSPVLPGGVESNKCPD